ncbi:hypothetical protein GIB67_006248 [Kingdonia uniflora]|uniref:Uncharacterized protein n=1 Tax=Kingdonia uniflora TaxID=39325 RepID=A0A7J7P568_9MAGN|nr:hypothetical protein GIB67_006248 [Kingdonia uniflora]
MYKTMAIRLIYALKKNNSLYSSLTQPMPMLAIEVRIFDNELMLVLVTYIASTISRSAVGVSSPKLIKRLVETYN